MDATVRISKDDALMLARDAVEALLDDVRRTQQEQPDPERAELIELSEQVLEASAP